MVSATLSIRRDSLRAVSLTHPARAVPGCHAACKQWALRPQKQLRLLRDGEVGGGGVRSFISNTYSLHCHHQNDSALRWAVV